MNIFFLGTGGGRINLLRQIRGTGGFRIDAKDLNIHVDPGPGALLNSLRLGLNVHKIDAVIVSHYHIDHVNDAALLVEAMAKNATKKGGILIGSKYTLQGDEKGDRGITLYHQNLVEQLHIAEWGVRKIIKTKKSAFDIEFIKTKHDEKTCFGFRLFIDGKVIGYTSDTEYYEGIAEAYTGCDYLILNCLKPAKDEYHGHMDSNDAIKIISAARPKLAILSHMGMRIITRNPDELAAQIERVTGVPTIAAKDGQQIK